MSSRNIKKNTAEETEVEKVEVTASDSPAEAEREGEKAPSFEKEAPPPEKEAASSEEVKEEEKKKYIVHSIRIRHKGKNYNPGEVIELTQEETQSIKKYIKERN